MIEAFLVKAGHQVTIALGPRQALEIARNESFDLVLCDINMPEMSGISLVSKLRRLDNFQYTPIIMVTTESADYKKEKAKITGASGWLQKPFDEERLLKAVNKMTG